MSETDVNGLRHGLVQMLQCYESSGVRRFNTQADCELDLQVLSQLCGTRGNNAPQDVPNSGRHVESVASSAVAIDTVPAAVGLEQAVGSSVSAVKPAASSIAPAPLLPVGNWQLPNMDDSERITKLAALDEQVKACRKCPELVCYRRQTVFGEGHIRPRVCFFGEAPGADEDAQGRPFVGAAGRLLTDIIRAMKLSREEVYILNSLKCRPPQNRTPLPEEVDNCRPYALTQLEILQPEFIILLGAVAVRSVLQTTESVGRLRGRFHHFHGARVLVTYHPAYLLRTPDAKKLVWQDVQMVMRELETA